MQCALHARTSIHESGVLTHPAFKLPGFSAATREHGNRPPPTPPPKTLAPGASLTHQRTMPFNPCIARHLLRKQPGRGARRRVRRPHPPRTQASRLLSGQRTWEPPPPPTPLSRCLAHHVQFPLIRALRATSSESSQAGVPGGARLVAGLPLAASERTHPYGHTVTALAWLTRRPTPPFRRQSAAGRFPPDVSPAGAVVPHQLLAPLRSLQVVMEPQPPQVCACTLTQSLLTQAWRRTGARHRKLLLLLP